MSFSFNFALESDSNEHYINSNNNNNNTETYIDDTQMIVDNDAIIENETNNKKFDLIEIILNFDMISQQNISNNFTTSNSNVPIKYVNINKYIQIMSKDVSRITTINRDLYKLCLPYDSTVTNNDNNISNKNDIDRPYSGNIISRSNDLLGTDLIPGLYEGGLKTWECSIDLCNYILKHVSNTQLKPTSNILELGCGSGLPGVCCLMHYTFNSITFIDYNEDVIENITWPNIIYNLKHADINNSNNNNPNSISYSTTFNSGSSGSNSSNSNNFNEIKHVLNKIHCFAGDWMKFNGMSSTSGCSDSCNDIVSTDIIAKYDLIITAETLYNKETCSDIAQLISKHLAFPHGIAYISSKRYYFGVGGGTSEFISIMYNTPISLSLEFNNELVHNDNISNYKWKIEIVEEIENKTSNLREILKISYQE